MPAEMPEQKPNHTISRQKRRLFKFVLFVMLYLFLEILSFGAFRLLEGRWYSWSTAAQVRNVAGSTPVNFSQRSYTATGVVHPYVGCVMRPDWRPKRAICCGGREANRS